MCKTSAKPGAQAQQAAAQALPKHGQASRVSTAVEWKLVITRKVIGGPALHSE